MYIVYTVAMLFFFYSTFYIYISLVLTFCVKLRVHKDFFFFEFVYKVQL